jgi:hypothetical protein
LFNLRQAPIFLLVLKRYFREEEVDHILLVMAATQLK